MKKSYFYCILQLQYILVSLQVLHAGNQRPTTMLSSLNHCLNFPESNTRLMPPSPLMIFLIKGLRRLNSGLIPNSVKQIDVSAEGGGAEEP